MVPRNLFSACRMVSILKNLLIGVLVFSLHRITLSMRKIPLYHYTDSDVKHSEPKTATKVLVDTTFYNYLVFNLRDTKYTGIENYTNYYVAQFGLKTLDQFQPILPGLGPVINDCTSFQYLINIQSCADQVNLNKTSIFVVVVSAPSYFEKRNTIRITWKKHLYNDAITGLIDVTGFAFLVGRTENASVQAEIEKESRNYRDIIQVNMVDTYNNLTLKYISLLNWLVNYCPRVQFVLKVDDDVYVNVRNLVTSIRALQPSDKSIYGRIAGDLFPSRQGTKWSYSFEIWPWAKIPKFIAGGGSLISGRAVSPLLASAQTTPFFVSDDMYISGLCNRKVNVTLRSSPNMFVFNPPDGKLNACFVKETITWLTDSYSMMNESNKLTEELYENNIRCLTGNKS